MRPRLGRWWSRMLRGHRSWRAPRADGALVDVGNGRDRALTGSTWAVSRAVSRSSPPFTTTARCTLFCEGFNALIKIVSSIVRHCCTVQCPLFFWQYAPDGNQPEGHSNLRLGTAGWERSLVGAQ
jgi:hypothetical protein